ncbi:hypothetical protein BKA93DRAFT_741551, partial [Sparassis latifolia]
HHIYDEDEEVNTKDISDGDTNYSMFDWSVDSIDITLSFARWFEGKGLVADAVIKGLRGVFGTTYCHISH